MRADSSAGRLVAIAMLELPLVLLLSPGSNPARAADETPLLAVVRFQVHSARPIEHLGESLANLVRTRLEASGEVRVLEPALLEERIDPAASDDVANGELRALADRAGAAYLITGSVTELAGRFSLDVRVTPAAVALPSHTLVLTAEREDELLDRVNELADRVLSEVVGVAPTVVAAIEIEGAGELTDRLRRDLLTREGDEFDPAKLREDLAMLRAHASIANANADTERGDEGVRVVFRIVGVEQLGAPVAERGTDRVAAVEIRGNRRIEEGAIRARISIAAGDPYRKAQISKDVREIYALGFFRNVRVFSEPSAKGRIVVFEVDENPVVRQISISGNDSVDADNIRDILTLTLGSALDYPLLFENRARIEALYRAQGYYLAQVKYEIETLSESSVGIHFLVDEKEKLKLRNIEFTGNEHFDDSELTEGFQTKTWRFYSLVTSWFDKSGTYSEPLFIQDLRSIEKLYTDAGFLQVDVGQPEVDPAPDGLTVTVPIVEGPQFSVGGIDVIGDETVDIEALKAKIQLREGAIFNRSHLTEDVAILTEHYTDRGFYFASVQPRSNAHKDDPIVDVVFQVEKGPLYFIRNINITGNTTTIDPVIRREIPIVEGQLYSQRQILLSRQRIQGLGFFEEVDFQVEPTDEPDQIDLEVAVVERPTGSFSFGAGFSSQDSFVVTASLAQSNLFGRGYNTNLSADIGGQTQRFYLSVQDPYFLGSDFSLGATLFRSTVSFEDFDQEQTGVDIVLGHSLSEDTRSRGFLRYSFATREIDEDQNVNAASLISRDLFQDSISTSLAGLSFSSDTRDDPVAPTQGYQLAGALEYAGVGFFTKFLRAEARAQWYIGAPRWLFENSAFVLASRVGYALPLNAISDYDFPEGINLSPLDGNILPLAEIDDDLKLPLSERYFLGGLGQFQLRGFKARSVGPRRAILYRDDITGNYLPVGRVPVFVDPDDPDVPANPGDPDARITTVCIDDKDQLVGQPGNRNHICNNISDKDENDFADLEESDVIGGNKFISNTIEYRFPISEALGLLGIVFFDFGNAVGEDDNLFDVTEWRYGYGAGLQWFSPFGPLAVVLGFPLDPLSIEDSPVFEFSVGGGSF